MKFVNIVDLHPKLLPKHDNVHSRRIWGPESGGKNCAVGYNYMFANGGSEIHNHESEHIFIILEGSCNLFDGSKTYKLHKGQAFIVEPGDMHRVYVTGEEDCTYITITSPPAWS